MRYSGIKFLCISSLLVGAIHCEPDTSPSDTPLPDASVDPDGGESTLDAGLGDDASPDASPADTCGVLQKFERDGGTVSASETWPVGDYLVKGTLYLKGTLTIPACTVLRLAPETNIIVDTGGALKLLGGATTKVRVTSSNTTPSAGDWGYIEFRSTSSSGDSEIHHSVLEYGGKGYGAIFVASGASVAIDHTTIKHSATYGVEVKSSGHLRGFTDNVITASGSAPVKIHVNSVGDLLGGTFTGNASDVISVDGGNLDRTTVWKNLGIPYRADTFYVKGAATPQKLTLEAGVTIQMRPSQGIFVDTAGGLHLAGTATAPVKITSSETSPSAGDWNYIEFRSDSTSGDNIIEHAIIEYGGKGYGAIYLAASASVKIKDSTVQHSEDVGLQVVSDLSALREFTGNTFTDNAQGHIRAKANVIGQIGAGTYASGGVNDVIRVDGGVVAKNATWGAWGVPYRIDATVYVQAPSGTATLTVAAGAKLAMANGQAFISDTRGVLNLAGTAASHVTVTSAAAAPIAGIWNYIEIRSLGNAFTYADVSYGGGGGNATGYGQLYVAASSSVALDHVVFSNGLLCDVDRANNTNATVTATNSTFVACPL